MDPWRRIQGICGLLVSWLFIVPAAKAATFEVGPGRDYESPGDVPWESLAAGDRVRIHWRADAYLDKWVICRQGTASQPIVVQGVPGPEGQLPVIDGNGAGTRQTLNYWNGPRGVIKIGGANVPPDTTPTHIVVENLEIRSARPPYSFTDHSGVARDYPNNAAAIYVEKGDFITIRNCVMHDCGNGLFVAAAATEVLIEGNYIHGNGNVDSIYEHNSYTAAAGITFQFNRYGPLRDGCLGNNLKDRSAGTVIRYNWIESGNRQLDLVDAEDSAALRQDPRYRSTFVYGNVLIEPDGAGNSQIVHYGGDSGDIPTYRKGILYFHHNTVVSTRMGNTTLLRLSTNDESADCRNNVCFVSASGNRLALLAEAGRLSATHNWSKPGRVNSHAGSGFTGTVTDDATWVEGNDPGFLDFTRQNYRLSAQSVCRDAGTSSHPDTTPAHAVIHQYAKHQRQAPRRIVGPPDLGAYEFSPFAAWRASRFPAAAEDDWISGPAADPDDDGFHNLVEYACDLDPAQPSPNGTPLPILLSWDDYFTVQFHRRTPPSELIYRLWVSNNLESWTPALEYSDAGVVSVPGVATDESDETASRARLVEPIATGSPRFVRITVELE
jgi:hypothetical protein